MFLSKKPQNPSKFNSMAQIQIKCVKLAKPLPSSKTNRSNSSLNLTSPPQLKGLKEKHEESLFALKPNISSKISSNISPNLSSKISSNLSPNSSSKISSNVSNNISNLLSTPKNYFLLPNHSTNSSNSSLNRAKTLHHSKMNLNSLTNEQLNDSNKENFAQKCSSPLTNSLRNSSVNSKNTVMNSIAKTPKNDSLIFKKKEINEEKQPNSHRSMFNRTLNSVQMKDIRETEEDFSEIKQCNEKNPHEFFCLRHPIKKVLFFHYFSQFLH